ncbi:MAG: TonB-dependent receptor plug domain-containing protein, partial [Muribaculaceae bacterium]|nr:TonB-dependent receptor plug domain-containing protein [Muribaculaceae bacterium]
MKIILSTFIVMFSALLCQARNITVNGEVLSATDSEPLIGVSVNADAGGAATATDLDGRFEIVVPEGSVLTFSYIGYRPQSLKAAAEMKVVMSEDSELLDEVVVVGYAVQRKVDVTGAITAVDVNEIAKQNENNPIKALQGRVPGMNISADGNPSGSSTVRIRGIGTLNNNDPLYIIDGVPTKSGMHELNAGDIESIQILKDAASASIYGSRAANGVIIITTKRGNDLKITLDASVAAQFYTNRMKVLNAEGYGRAMWQAYVNDGQDPNTNGLGYRYNWGYNSLGYPTLHSISMSKYLDAAGNVPAADTDWFDETTRTGMVQNYN